MIGIADLAERGEQLLAGIEVEAVDVVQFLIDRRWRPLILPAQPVVQGQFAGDLPVVLNEEVVRQKVKCVSEVPTAPLMLVG